MKGEKLSLKLTARLEKIATLVTEGAFLADIGTDHGYIPIYLLNKGVINRAVLSDINKGPLDNARSEIKKNNLEKMADLRLGSGLEILDCNEVDEVIIAGMGGILISEIIKKDLEICKMLNKMILQPMQASEELRFFLIENGFEIMDEHLVNEDFRIYEIIECKYNPKFYERKIDMKNYKENLYFEIPQKLIDKKEDLLVELINRKLKECESILKKLSEVEKHLVSKRIDEINTRRHKLKRMLVMIQKENRYETTKNNRYCKK